MNKSTNRLREKLARMTITAIMMEKGRSRTELVNEMNEVRRLIRAYQHRQK